MAGANYGWPATEGSTTNAEFDSRRYAYSHSGGACAITGGAFYSPLTARIPLRLLERLFLRGLLRRLDSEARSRRRQASSRSRQGLRRPSISRCPTMAVSIILRAAAGLCTGSTTPRPRRASHAPRQPDRTAGRVGDVQRESVRSARASVSVAAQRRQHRRSDGPGLHRIGSFNRTTARASEPSSATTPAASPATKRC